MASAEKGTSHFLLDGNYRPSGTQYSSLVIQGDTALAKNHNGTGQALKIKYGEFGEADPEIARASREMFYNMELRTEEGKFKTFGVVSADGKKIIMKGNWGISCNEWITEEEAAALKNEGDLLNYCVELLDMFTMNQTALIIARILTFLQMLRTQPLLKYIRNLL